MKQWREKNKEREAVSGKQYRKKNKERIAARDKQYYEANKEKINARLRQWREDHPEENHRSDRISCWKYNGVIHDDYDVLYDQYMAATHCADCGVVFGERGDGTGTFKSLDHCHETGAFRDVVCNACNRRRGVVDSKIKSETPELAYLVRTLEQEHNACDAI